MRATLRIGCSGWNYRHWRGPFYPPELRVRDWFAHYAAVFDTVEINNTFYRLPEPATFERWRESAPPGFLFAIKASRFLTHLKRLRDPEEPVTRLFEHARELHGRFGPVLYQLPANFHCDLKRLDDFLAILPRRLAELDRAPAQHALKHVFEFRHPSWYVDETYAVLASHAVALCLHDKAGSAITEPIDGPFVYVRFHGPQGRYFGRYAKDRLDRWAGRLVEQLQAGRDVFAYFNNDPEGMAVVNAQELKELMAARIRGEMR
jgi:uncharacterized protein YecE (DUF72 family)